MDRIAESLNCEKRHKKCLRMAKYVRSNYSDDKLKKADYKILKNISNNIHSVLKPGAIPIYDLT